jgi:hypothetical protein
MYTYPGSRSWDFTQAASFRPSCLVTRQSISKAPRSSLIRVDVDGGQVAEPTASSKPGTALGIGLGSATNTSKSRLIASGRANGSANETRRNRRGRSETEETITGPHPASGDDQARDRRTQQETRGRTSPAISSIWRRSSPSGQKWTRWQPARA